MTYKLIYGKLDYHLAWFRGIGLEP